MTAQLDFLHPPPEPAENADSVRRPSNSSGLGERKSPIHPKGEDRRQKARAIQESGARRWILAGKPIALEVARVRGEVTAETFRAAAEKLNALPPTYGAQRALSWIPSMFYHLCREGQLQKRRRVDGSIVKAYSESMGNFHTVYELVEGAR